MRSSFVTVIRAVVQAVLNSASVFLITWQVTDETKTIIIATATVFVSALTTRGVVEGWWDSAAENRSLKRAARARVDRQAEIDRDIDENLF